MLSCYSESKMLMIFLKIIINKDQFSLLNRKSSYSRNFDSSYPCKSYCRSPFFPFKNVWNIYQVMLPVNPRGNTMDTSEIVTLFTIIFVLCFGMFWARRIIWITSSLLICYHLMFLWWLQQMVSRTYFTDV